MRIERHEIGGDVPCFVIAEAGVNHNGDPALAHALVDAAADAGADAIKFQTFEPDALVAADAPKAEYQLANDGAGSQAEMLARLVLPRDAHLALADHARSRGIVFLSTPFDEGSADLLAELGVGAFKIGSGDVTNLPLLAHVARKGRPIVLSTGMSTLDEVGEAVATLRSAGCESLVLLHCVSSYPAPVAEMNLRAMATLAAQFAVPVGLSDHTHGIAIATAAVALGARVIEKHVTTDRRLPGPDHLASLEPHELRAMIDAIRAVESALGDGRKVPTPSERSTAAVARRSIHFRSALAAGASVTERDFIMLRPGTGLTPRHVAELVGRRLRRDVGRHAMARREDFE